MKRAFIILSAILVMAACAPQRPVKECPTYTEAADPSPDSLANWKTVKPGLHASIGSIDHLYAKSSTPSVETKNSWEGAAWQGERVSAQLVLWGKEAIRQIECEFSDFKSPAGETLPASLAQARFVRYVITDEFGNGCGKRKPEDFAASLSPDLLDPLECFDMEPQTTRPVWISIDIPPGTVPGTYTSTMQLFASGKKHSSFTFQIEVLPRILPPASEWKFHLDLWQNPYAVARVQGVEPWSEAHWEALHPLMKMLAGAGQKVITATLNNRPWGGQTQDAFGSMIGWTKKTDGNWQYDYSIFDNWVRFMMDLGIQSQINCYSMVPWGNELYYFDEKTGEEIKVKAEPGTKQYAELWVPFLRDFTLHLEEKGWKEITCIAMDERAPAEMQAMLKLLSETAPGLGVALADNHKSYKLYPDQLVDLCVAHGSVVEPEDRQYRKTKGYVTTWYVCCGHEFPNVFTFSPPAEGAFIGWYTMAADFDGFLRWAYNSWVKEPLLDSRFRTWPAGDTYVVYPGARSSIRFERLLEGIQDAEKIRILKEELQNDASAEAKEKLELLNQTVALFNTTEKPDNLEELMAQGKQVLAGLSR
ncbi:MAG: DUF4091 domain-containing protein [Prolixibacteraceae bacterium]|nr:DUF4091 domain-containing protein [Prolixibacteraceae bacterium]